VKRNRNYDEQVKEFITNTYKIRTKNVDPYKLYKLTNERNEIVGGIPVFSSTNNTFFFSLPEKIVPASASEWTGEYLYKLNNIEFEINDEFFANQHHISERAGNLVAKLADLSSESIVRFKDNKKVANGDLPVDSSRESTIIKAIYIYGVKV
jgi:hypothetical protein